ncbi:MAG: hypothetical protein ACPH93_03755, partial [Candidatus Poseidoniaceae archaeon]
MGAEAGLGGHDVRAGASLVEQGGDLCELLFGSPLGLKAKLEPFNAQTKEFGAAKQVQFIEFDDTKHKLEECMAHRDFFNDQLKACDKANQELGEFKTELEPLNA